MEKKEPVVEKKEPVVEHVVKEPIAKFVFNDIIKKAREWSKVYPFFKQGLDDGFKNPEKCFRQNGDDDYYNTMKSDIQARIKEIAGSDWGETYNTKRRAASDKELEEFKKRFGSLGIDSIFYDYDPLDDGLDCGEDEQEDKQEEVLEKGKLEEKQSEGGARSRNISRRNRKANSRRSRRKKINMRDS